LNGKKVTEVLENVKRTFGEENLIMSNAVFSITAYHLQALDYARMMRISS
jgi:hypothetical protein